ncbi:MAG TPA: hypothetical protein PLI13_07415 [Paracoccus sp. (in: a-proteobacteria)]|nr:hypothetical protein [Paracoccus sp. (in: a-proteobacteria)]
MVIDSRDADHITRVVAEICALALTVNRSEWLDETSGGKIGRRYLPALKWALWAGRLERNRLTGVSVKCLLAIA